MRSFASASRLRSPPDSTPTRFSIASPERNLDLTVTPRKCSIQGTTNVAGKTGTVSVKCSDDNLFQDITADQVASMQAAFNGNKRVTIKASGSNAAKGSISIQIKGDSFREE
jgi:hypothetical protein